MASDDEAMGYVARKTCGCLAAMIVDAPDYRRMVAREIGSWIRTGYTIERLTVVAIRVLPWRCPVHEAEVAERKAAIKQRQTTAARTRTG